MPLARKFQKVAAVEAGVTAARDLEVNAQNAGLVIQHLQGRVEEPVQFARQTLERFRNPFVEHKLADIATHHASKVQVRLAPTKAEYEAKFGKAPPLLTEVLAMDPPT